MVIHYTVFLAQSTEWVEQIPSWVKSLSWLINSLPLWNPKVQYCIHMIAPLDSLLNQFLLMMMMMMMIKVNVKGKVVPVISLSEHHALEAYCRSGGIAARFLDLSTRWRWVVSFTTRPLCPQVKSPWYPLDRRLVGPQSRSGRGGENKNSQPLPGFEPRSLTTVHTPLPCSWACIIVSCVSIAYTLWIPKCHWLPKYCAHNISYTGLGCVVYHWILPLMRVNVCGIGSSHVWECCQSLFSIPIHLFLLPLVHDTELVHINIYHI